MNSKFETLDEINTEAIHLLCREMGVSKTIRFLNQFHKGAGDYTKEREGIFAGMSVADIVAEIKETRQDQNKTK